MDILMQLNRAMEYIEAHIDDDMALSEVAGATTYSPFHFGRLFYYITDLPLSEYIRRRKLSRAAMDLKAGRERVIDIAVKYGYDSADSFSRAFVKQHGATPSAARKREVMLRIFAPLTFHIKIEGAQSMNWRIERKEAFEVVGIGRRFKNDGTNRLPAFWDENFENGSLRGLMAQTERGSLDLLGLCGNVDETADDFLYMIGVYRGKDTDTRGLMSIKAPAAEWAVFRSEEFGEEKGYGDHIPELSKRAYSEWLPTSGYDKLEARDGEIYDMEVYSAGDNGKRYEEVWISVVKKA